MNETIVSMQGINKSFPGVKALDNVSLTVHRGTVHALMGENGAGKRTLMNILTGIYRPDSGKIYYKGQKCSLKNPKMAVSMGIGMVHQHFRLVETLTVSENVYLGTKECRNLLNLESMHSHVAACSDQFGMEVDPRAKIWQLSTA